ncbi:MAG: LysM peptidoglycan-binding domain-containing protein [Clostridia bacterium]|nr:LysM peptidoglycan-binding domain-containing protein [Clostridia bacterium]
MSCNIEWNCPPGSFPYTVRQGDTLYSISKRFESSVIRLAQLNKIEDVNVLSVGQVLCIPQPLQYFPACRTSNYYVVHTGDTLESIADYFGVSSSQILYSNIGIDPDYLYDGMILCIPLAPPKLCVNVKGTLLTLSYENGDEATFRCINNLSDFSSQIAQKQLDTSFGGKKRLNTLVPNIAISSKSAQRSENDIILSDRDMDTVFNLVPVGAGVYVE